MPRNGSMDYFLAVWDLMNRERKRGPAAVVICGNHTIKKEGISGDFLTRYNSGLFCNQQLCSALASLNKIGHGWVDPNGKAHTIGTCAENDAADKYLNSFPNQTISLNTLLFSDAYRPRTRRMQPYCTVCKRTFGL